MFTQARFSEDLGKNYLVELENLAGFMRGSYVCSHMFCEVKLVLLCGSDMTSCLQIIEVYINFVKIIYIFFVLIFSCVD